MILNQYSFGELGQIFDGPHATPKRQDTGPYFLNISSLVNGRLDLTLSDHVSDQDFARWTKRVTPQEGDLLFSYETRLGDAAMMPPGVKACLGRRMALLRPNREIVDPRFLLYFYLSPDFQELIQRYTIHGATVNRISLSTMGSWPVTIPPLVEQRAIAEVLSVIDDKITICQDLTSIADRLADAKFAALMAQASNAVNVGSILTLEYGKALPATRRTPGPVQVFGSGGIVGTHNEALLNGPGVIVGRKGTVGATYWANGPHFPIDTTFYVTPTRAGVSKEFCYFLLKSLPLAEMNSDSAVPGLNRNEVHATRVQLPKIDGIKRFSSEIGHLFSYLAQLRDQIASLSRCRDALLPELMSRRIRVMDAETSVVEVM